MKKITITGTFKQEDLDAFATYLWSDWTQESSFFVSDFYKTIIWNDIISFRKKMLTQHIENSIEQNLDETVPLSTQVE